MHPTRFHGSFWLKISIIAGWILALSAALEAASLRLDWQDTSTNETGFKIERLDGQPADYQTATYAVIATVGANVQTYTDTTALDGSTYCYRVRSFNSMGDGGTTNAACATAATTTTTSPPPTTDPPPSTNLATWGDYEVSAKIRSADNDAIGIMFRYQDKDNYYRFTWFAEGKYRRLEKRVGGTFTTLAEDRTAYKSGQTYLVQVVTQGSFLKVLINGKIIFSVIDTAFSEGGVALYSYYNAGSYFDDVMVTDLATGTVLLSDDFNDLDFRGWTIIDEGNDGGPSTWSAASGVLVQSSNIGSTVNNGNLGTYALYTKRAWYDYQVSFKMRSDDDDRLGVMFRYQDDQNYYRFSWDKSGSRRQLVKRENGVFTVLAEDAVPYSNGITYQVEIVAQGSSLKVNIDGSAIFAVSDASLDAGTVAFYSSYNQGSFFDDLLVEDLATKSALLWDDFNHPALTGWTRVDDAGTTGGPSLWSISSGVLVQSSNIGSDATGYPGTFLLY